jgi:hypothetical protein
MGMDTTLRKFLDSQGFDWNTGKIIVQPASVYKEGDKVRRFDSVFAGYEWGAYISKYVFDADGMHVTTPEGDDLRELRCTAFYIDKDSPILDGEFYDGYGGTECPAFIAEDKDAFYTVGQYDGSTFPFKIYKDINKYLVVPVPYPGGG